MAIFTFSGRSVLLQYLMTCPIFLAVGEGVSTWGEIPDDPDYEAIGLINVFGYKKLTRAFFVNQDDYGDIDMPGGLKYKYSETPTRDLYMHFMFSLYQHKDTVRASGKSDIFHARSDYRQRNINCA